MRTDRAQPCIEGAARAMRRGLGAFAAAICLSLLAGCVTNDGPPPVIGYNPLYSQADHMKRLVAAGNFDEAVALHGREAPFFAGNADGTAALLDAAARGFNAQWERRIADATASCAAVGWPAPREGWAGIRAAISGCTGVLRDYEASNGLTRGTREATGIAELRRVAGDLSRRIGSDAASLMATEDLASGRNLISEYPIDMPLAPAFAARLSRSYDPVKPDEARLFRIAAAYAPQVRDDQAIRQALVDAVSATLRTKARSGSLRDVAATWREASRHGVAPTRIPLTAAVYAVGGGAVPFPATIAPDLPLEWKPLSGLATIPDVDFVVALGPASLGVERKATDQAKVPSRFVSGTRSTPNPAYAAAVAEFTRAQQQVASANAQQISAATDIRCSMYGCQPNYAGQIVAAIFAGVAASNLESAQKKLTATPPSIEEAIFEDYSFDTASVAASKKVEFVAYVGRPRTGAVEQYRHSFAGSEGFKVSQGVHAKDATLASVPFVPEKAVEDWEKRPVEVLLSTMLKAAPDRRAQTPWPLVAATLDRASRPASAPAQAAQRR